MSDKLTPETPRGLTAWAVLWHSRNRLDGESRYLIWTPLFHKRRECRTYIDETFGYIRNRPDLQREPHGWHIPKAVRVTVLVLAAGPKDETT